MLDEKNLKLFRSLDAMHRVRKDKLYTRTSERRAELLRAIKLARDALIERAFDTAENSIGRCPALGVIKGEVCAYASRSDWAFFDLLALAACSDQAPEAVAKVLAPRALIFHALRMLDDALDGHVTYKGGVTTLLGAISAVPALEPVRLAVSVLTATLLTIEGALGLTDADRSWIDRTLLGMVEEVSGLVPWSRDRYREMAKAKMVSYGMFLYSPVVNVFGTSTKAALGKFLEESFFVAQMSNDLHDRENDRGRKQPNYWLLTDGPEAAVPQFVAEVLLLSNSCASLTPDVVDYGHARVADLLHYILQVSDADPCGLLQS
jgi:hypothetical protein